MEYGETSFLNTQIINKSNEDLTNIELVLNTDNPYITLLNDTLIISELLMGESIEIENSLSFYVDVNIPNESLVDFVLELRSNDFVEEGQEVEVTVKLLGKPGVENSQSGETVVSKKFTLE